MGKKRTEFQLLQESMEKKSTELTSVLREAEAECAARQREARVRERVNKRNRQREARVRERRREGRERMQREARDMGRGARVIERKGNS